MSSSSDQPLRGFQDRAEAGRLLAQRLNGYAARVDVVVLALPRGGVPVAFEIAKALRAPLDIIVVLKLKVARYPELGLGAVADGGSYVVNDDLVKRLGISASAMTAVLAVERGRLAARILALRGERRALDAAGAVVILVDDGLATGATMRAAIAAVRSQNPARIIVAVPVASREAADCINQLADEFVCVITPASFVSVGNWYQSFAQVGDDDVSLLLDLAARLRETANGGTRS